MSALPAFDRAMEAIGALVVLAAEQADIEHREAFGRLCEAIPELGALVVERVVTGEGFRLDSCPYCHELIARCPRCHELISVPTLAADAFAAINAHECER